MSKSGLPSLNVGDVVKITGIVKKAVADIVHLFDGIEGVVWYHNDVFKLDDGTESDQTGPEGEKMYDFVMPGSGFRIGPIMKMPDNHKVIVWIVRGAMYNVTNVTFLFNGSVKWYIKRSGEVLNLGSDKIVQ